MSLVKPLVILSIAADKLALAPDPGAMAAAAWYRAAALSLKNMSCHSEP